MADITFNDLSLKELKQLEKDVGKAIANFEDRQKSEARAKLEEQARAMGFSLAELVGLEVKKQRAPAVAKYQHPENSELTWSGRGRKPKWFIEALANGTSPDSLAI